MRSPSRASRTLLAAALGLAALAPRTARADRAPALREAPEVAPPDDGPPLPPDSSVRLELTLDAQGAVTDARVLEGLRPDVDARVLEAARAMRFEPATRNGQPVPARLRFRYRLRARPTPAPSAPAATPSAPPPAASRGPRARPAAAPPAPRRVISREDDAVLVRARSEPGAVTRTTLRAEELTSVPGTFGEPLRVVSSLPGVGRSPLGFGFFLVRGASFENTGFLVDGFPVLNLYHFGAGPSVLSPRFVSQLDFYPGNYPLAYGRFSAGLISVRTEAPRNDRVHADLELDLFRASGFVSAPFARGRGTVAVAARRSYYDPFLSLVTPGVGLSFGDAQLYLAYRFSDRLTASVFTFASTDTFTVGHQGPFYPSDRLSGLKYDYWRTIARLQYRASPSVSFEYGAMVGGDLVQVLSARDDSGSEVSRLTGGVGGQRGQVRITHGAALTTTAGFDLLAQAYRTTATTGSDTVPPTDYTQLSASLYLDEAVRAGRLELVGGVRLDYVRYRDTERLLADPRVVARVRLYEGLTAVLGTGFFHQLPNALLLVAGIPLPPQRAWQSSLGVEWAFRDWFDARVTTYLNYLYDLPRTGGVVPAFAGAGASFDLDAPVPFDGQGRAYGLELMLRRRLERGLYGWVSYTLSRSERYAPGDARARLFNYDQTHVLNLALSWRVHPRWRLGARFQLATGSPSPIYSGGIYDVDDRRYDGFVSAQPGRTPVSNQLDLRVDHFFRWGPAQMTAFLDIINVYNAQNGDLGWTNRYDFSARVPAGGLPFLPTLGLRGEL